MRKCVANIAEVGTRVYDVPTFRQLLVEGLFVQNEAPVCTLSSGEWEDVTALADGRYRRWEGM